MAELDRKPRKDAFAVLGRRRRSRQPKQVVAIELDDALLRVVVCSRRGERGDFQRIATAPLALPADLEKPDADVLGKAIAAALQSLNLKPGAVVLGVPRAQVVLRTVSLPQLDDMRELASMVQLQVGKDLPYRKDEAVVDFEVRPGQPAAAPAAAPADDKGAAEAAAPAANNMAALVAVVQREIVEFYRKTCAAAGVKLAALGLLPHANARCVTACGAAEPEHAVALVSLRKAEVSVDIMFNGALLFSRGAILKTEPEEAAELPPLDVPRNGAPAAEATTPAEPAVPPVPLTFTERVTIEVVRSLHAFGGMASERGVAKVLVVGDTGEEAGVIECLARKLTMPVALLDVGAALGIDEADRALAGGAASTIGLALAATDVAGLPFDFLNPKRPAVQRDMKRVRLLAAAAALVVLFFGVLGVRAYLVRGRMRIQQAIQQELTDVQKHQAIYRKTRAQAASISGWMKEGRDWLEHYAYLTAILPGSEDVYITSLTVSPQGTIRLAVQAQSGEILANVDKQLRAAGYDVKPQAITPGTDRYGYNFRSSVELIVTPRMKIDLSKVKAPSRPADDVSLNPSGKTAALKARSPSIAMSGGAQ